MGERHDVLTKPDFHPNVLYAHEPVFTTTIQDNGLMEPLIFFIQKNSGLKYRHEVDQA
jgi:hypothetical protein